MIEPHGPLPEEVYWRRRLLAAAGIIGAAALVIGLIVWAGSGRGEDPNARTVASTGEASTKAAEPTTETSTPVPDEAADEKSGDTGADAPTPQDPTPASEEAPAPAPSEEPAPAPAEQGPPPCSDQQLSVVVYTDKPTYTKGDQPEFTVVTTNGGLAECSRDVGKAATNVVVRSLDGARTLWAAQDCAPDKTVDNQVLKPGQQVSDKITWSGTTSNPGCDKPRTTIHAGAYQAVAMNGQRESAPITFNVVKPAEQ